MAHLPQQKLNLLYNQYGEQEIAFNRSIIQTTGLKTENVFIKVRNDQWPCVLYSCSMRNARIIINLDQTNFEQLKNANNLISLRLSFFPQPLKKPINFFIPSSVVGYNSFKLKQQNTFLMNIEFSQKPPEDHIEILGKIIETAQNFERRKELRVPIDEKILGKLQLTTNKLVALVDRIKRPCILRNLSASGCLLIMACNPKFVINKEIIILLITVNLEEPLAIAGKIVNSNIVEGRQDMAALGVAFDKDKIPHGFKDLINNYLDELESIVKSKRISKDQVNHE
ncbi:MAG: PilZ domain-containing protein [Spirochaetes bacterium]|nr:PilZ domain-containing protein [Spirochaetota bacterium]